MKTTPSSTPTKATSVNSDFLTVSDLALEFGVSHNAIRYHLNDLYPDNAGKHFKLRGEEQARARKYLGKVLVNPRGAFSGALVAELTAIAALYGVTVRALHTDTAAGFSRTLAVSPGKNGAPRVQIISSQTEVLAAL